MPHPGTHITVVQRLALSSPKLAAVLGSPDPNASAANVAAVRKMRFASLGAVGPDLFYFMADYMALLQGIEDRIVQLAGTLEAVKEVGEELDKVQDQLADEAAVLTCGASTIIAELTGDDGLGGAAKLLLGALTNLLQDLAIEAGFNPWSQFELRRQQDHARTKWFWADYLHYVKSGDFVLKLLEKSRFDPKYKGHPDLFAYALGYLTHYVTDAVGHPYVNQIVQAPYRLYWQRHALVENFIDAYVWARWHVTPAGGGAGETPLDQVVAAPGNPSFTKGAPLQNARLHDLIDCGGQGLDPVDEFVRKAAEFVKAGIDELADLDDIEVTDDEEFVLWTQFMAECIGEVYGGIVHPENLGKGPAGLPTADNINGAYGVARFFLKLMSDEGIREPEFPDIAGDLSKELKELWDELQEDLGAIPSPPSLDTSGSFSFKSFWKQLKAWAQFVAETATAVVQGAIHLIKNLCDTVGQAGRDAVKMAFYLVNKALWAVYQALRETLVFAAYAQPTLDQVAAFKSLWVSPGNLPAGSYPVEEYFQDGVIPQAELWSDYEPLTVPNTQAGAVVEQPPVAWTAPYKAGATPDAFIDGSLGKSSMFGPPGEKSPAGPTQDSTTFRPEPDTSLSTFTDLELDYGGALANCAMIIQTILDHNGQDGQILPGDLLFPNYNLDGDRGYGWPCWDVQGPQIKLRPNHLPPPHQAIVAAVTLES